MKKNQANEMIAVLICGKKTRKVKAWQYYTILDFCREHGESIDTSDEVARWCQRKAAAGDNYEGNGYRILIKEK